MLYPDVSFFPLSLQIVLFSTGPVSCLSSSASHLLFVFLQEFPYPFGISSQTYAEFILYIICHLYLVPCLLSIFFSFCLYIICISSVDSHSLSSVLISRLSPGVEERLGWLSEGDRSPQKNRYVTCPHHESTWTVWRCWLSLYAGDNLTNFSECLVLRTSNSWSFLLLHEGSCCLIMQPFLWQHHTILKQLHDVFNQFTALYIKPPVRIWEILA